MPQSLLESPVTHSEKKLQQPLQLDGRHGVHTCRLHTSFDWQRMHWAPFEPHDRSLSPPTQKGPLQQPEHTPHDDGVQRP